MAVKELKFTFRITEEGDVKVVNRKNFISELTSTFPKGSQIVATFRLPKKIRSEEQNGFYWGVFVYSQIDCFKERWGELFTISQVHDWNKSNVWCKEIIVGDTIEKIPDTSTNKTTAEWEERLERCRQFFLIHFDWQLPIPEKQEKIRFK